MTRALAQSPQAAEISAADTLLAQLLSLHQKTLKLLSKAEGAGDVRCALAAVQQGRCNIELLWKLHNELPEAEKVNVTVQSEWIHLRASLLRVLEQFPQARLAILEALSDNG